MPRSNCRILEILTPIAKKSGSREKEAQTESGSSVDVPVRPEMRRTCRERLPRKNNPNFSPGEIPLMPVPSSISVVVADAAAG